MKKKKMIGIVLAMVLVLGIAGIVYAVTGTFTMNYLQGTRDIVTNMPDSGSGMGGFPYIVSDRIPQREGYEFLGWTLDYGVVNTYTLTYQVIGDPTYGIPGDTSTPDHVTGIREGSNVTLSNALVTAWVTGDGSPAPTTATYKVNYLKQGTDRMLAPQKVVTDKTIGSTVTEDAIDIAGYKLVSVTPQSLTLKPNKEGKWTFTGWCSDEACTTPVTEITNISADTTVYGKWVYSETENNNEITFYYEKMPEVHYTDYVVSYIDMDTGEKIIPDVIREHYEVGSVQTEYPPEIEDYTPLDNPITFEVVEGTVVTFIYYCEI